ncbi:hypothetical protein EOM09_03230 [bacterium]|jgi:transposase|nr:hypothetical protein [bacterium]
MEKTKSKHYDLEFKKDVVRLSYEGTKTIVQLSKDLGVSQKNIYRWRNELEDKGLIKIEQSVLDQAQELRRLRRENAEIKEERDILKKAMAIFTVKTK